MYIIKNAFLSITRNKGRNILIFLIIMSITIASCVAITINKSGKNLLNSYISNNPLEVSFELDRMSYRNASDEDKTNFELLNIDKINEIGKIDTIIDYYYMLETSLNSSAITAISTSDMFNSDSTDSTEKRELPNKGMGMQSGDFRITAYSDISYNEEFIEGTKKIKEGTMVDKDSTNMVISISEELATENNLSVGSKVIFTDTEDETITYEFEIIGIFENKSEETDNFMNMNAMNSQNQIYTNITSLNKILNNRENNTNSITSKFFIKQENIEDLKKDIKDLNISEYYQLTTNIDEIEETLKPIESISNFSKTFLFVVIIVGIIVLVIINLLNIRERKYEIGVLRAIGMTKFKTTVQLVSEILIVAFFSLIMGSGIGASISQPVSNYMLKNEISSYQEEKEKTANNFGGDNFERPGFNNNSSNEGNRQMSKTSNNVEYINELRVNTDFETILELFGVGLLLTLSSGIVAVMFVNKYEPNKILQNRG